MKSPSFHIRSARGFSIIELLITVAILGVLAAIAVPAFNKRVFDAKEVDMIKQGREAFRDQMRVKQLTGTFTECISGCDEFNLLYRPSQNTKINLITGAILFDPSNYPNGKFSLTDLGYTNVPSRRNTFGIIRDTDTHTDKMLMGLEADLLGNNTSLHVIAFDESGNMHTLCDQWSGQSNGSLYSTWIAGGTLKCNQTSSDTCVGDDCNECTEGDCGI